MKSNFPTCLAFTLKQEGGWANNPNDPGGCTMEGVTLPAYQKWKGDTSLTCTDLHGISSDEVAGVYEQDYWEPVQGDALPSGVDMMVWDMAVNAGVSGSGRLLQAVLGVPADGRIGPATMAAVASQTPATLINNLAAHQSDYYKSLHGFKYFGKGWLSRVEARRQMALQLAAKAPPEVTPDPPTPLPPRVDPTDVPPPTFWSWLQNLFNL